MRTVDEVVQAVVDQSGLLFRQASAERRHQAIKNRIEQVHGMAELSRWFGYHFLAQRFELHIQVLKQTLDPH